MNAAYRVDEGRPAWKRFPLSILYTLGLAVMVILGVGLMLIGRDTMDWVAQQVGWEQTFVTVWNWLRLPIGVLLLMLAVAVAYYVIPDVDQEFRFITPGSVVAVLVWVVASIGFGFYVRNFADYSATYGSLGAVIILLFYIYITAAVLLFGTEINAVIEHHDPEGKNPGEKNKAEHAPDDQRVSTREHEQDPELAERAVGA